MSDPITEANQVVAQWELEIEKLHSLERRAANAEVAYRVARAEAFDQAKGSVAARQMHTDKVTAEASLLRFDTAADVRVQQEKLRRIRALLDLKRSEIATDRAFSGVAT